MPDAQEIAGMEDDLQESFERWHTLLETAFGFCGNVDLCPRHYNRTLCPGCPHLVVDPRKRKNAVYWRNVYAQLAEECEAKGSAVDARQIRLQVRDLETLLQDYVQKDIKITELEAELARHRQYLEGLRLTIQQQEHRN